MTKKKRYTVVAFQHGKEVFRCEVENITKANAMVKNLCKVAMKEKEDLMFSIYDKKNALEIANGDYWKGHNYYYYSDMRNDEFFKVNMHLD